MSLDFPVLPPTLPRPIFSRQFWGDLTFVHWPVDPDAVAPLLPSGTRPDIFDGVTYVGLVPFAMRRASFGIPWPVPPLASFLETNVRLYSVDAQGRHGVVFRSLESERALMVPGARLSVGLPYTWARMRMARAGDRITYDSERLFPRRGLRSRVSVRIGEPTEPSGLEMWLTARWGAHTRRAGRTWWVPNAHGPWPLQAAELLDLDDDLVTAGGVRPIGDPLRPLHSPGVLARFGRPSRVRLVQ